MALWSIFYILLAIHLVKSHGIEKDNLTEQSRRILSGHTVGDTRPYMVYLRRDLAMNKGKDPSWLCGGTIVHPRHIVTSAACIEDVQFFYVISGTHKWVSNDQDNECIKNGAKKAVWKCVPKSYVYDGEDFDNISWMSNDIAVVKVEDEFNFNRRIKGCDYPPAMLPYNKDDITLEKKGTVGSTAGWGSVDKFSNSVVDLRSHAANSPDLLETDVVLLSKKNCKKVWEQRYHNIIDESMICAKDSITTDASICAEHEVNCKDLVYSDEEADDGRRRILDPKLLTVHTAAHFNETRRSNMHSGGFCENDHGGPLIVGRGKSAVLVGIVSACLTRDVTRKCYGPFLYTSVYKNRNLISCAIYNELSDKRCRVFLRTTNTQVQETIFDWEKKTMRSIAINCVVINTLRNGWSPN